MLLYNDHYVLIKNLNKLLNKHGQHSTHHCARCLQAFQAKELLECQKKDCEGTDGAAVIIEMPKNKYIEFENYKNQLEVPYTIYADFEAILKKNLTHMMMVTQAKSSTIKKSIHEPCGFCYTVVRSDGEVEEPVLYRGPGAPRIFLKNLQEEEKKDQRKV